MKVVNLVQCQMQRISPLKRADAALAEIARNALRIELAVRNRLRVTSSKETNVLDPSGIE
jgi:hypothetical protein